MKKKIQALCASLFMGILLFMAGVQTFAEPSYTSKFFDWGNLLKQYANDENGNEMIYARGKNGVITNKEVEQAMMFYTTFGMNQEDAAFAIESSYLTATSLVKFSSLIVVFNVFL